MSSVPSSVVRRNTYGAEDLENSRSSDIGARGLTRFSIADSGDREKLFFVEKGLRKKTEDFMSSLRQQLLDLKIKKKSLEEDLAQAKCMTQAAENAQRDLIAASSHIGLLFGVVRCGMHGFAGVPEGGGPRQTPSRESR